MKFNRGQLALVRETPLRAPARAATAVTIAEYSGAHDDRERPYIVTIDDGPCAGLRLWAAEKELAERPAGRLP